MKDELDNKTALVKYEPPYIEGEIVRESWIERKRGELRRALEAGSVRDPITGSILGSILLSTAISAATAGASYLLQRAFAPNPKPLEKGRTTGQLAISSQLGILIPEAYFGDPGDGLGGTLLPAIVISLSPIAKQVNVSRQETGGGKGGGGQTQEVRETVYYFPYIAWMYGRGPLRALRLKANADVIYDLYGQVSTYEGESASAYTGTAFVTSFEAASGGKEITLGVSASVQWNTVQSNGAATRQLTIYYRTSLGTPMPIEYTLNGGTPVAVTLPTTNEAFGRHTISLSLLDGANTFKIQNVSPSFNLGIDKIYCFPGHTTAGSTTGIFEPTTTPDDPYDPYSPENPTLPYERPFERFSAIGAVDEYGVQTGTLLHGGNAQFAIYPGNYVQLPDPTMQAAIDALHGADSTPAYRGRMYEVDANLYLTRWSNAIPNRTALCEHDVIRTLEQFCNDRCVRVNIASGDYDYSELEDIKPRGLRMLGQRYEAREHMTQAETLFNVYFTEEEFQIKGKLQGGVSVATLTDEDFGWIEGDELPENLSALDISEPDATKLPASVEVRHLSLDREGDPGLQGYGRHETIGVETETLDFSDWTFTNDEAQEIAQRVTYQRYVEKPVRFNLSWKFLWLIAGQVITANLASGYSYEIQVDKIAGGVGVLECEGHLVDVPVYTQPVSTGSGGFGAPIVPVPAMSILTLLDIPIRPKDETFNNGVVVYGAVTPRTNSGQTWTGASLYANKVGWERVADFTLPATIGVISDFDINTTDTSVFDPDGWIEFDVYHTDKFTPVLESVTEADVLAGANPLAINTSEGELIIHFATAEQVSPNHWKVSNLLYGRGGTEHLLPHIATGRRVVVLNEAVQPIPMNLSDLNRTIEYKAVTFGQSLDDAATVENTWTGISKRPLSPVIVGPAYPRDSAGDILIQPYPRSRVGGGLRSDQNGVVTGERLIMKAQPLHNGSTTLPNGKTRIMTFDAETPQAAFLQSVLWDVPSVNQNNFIASSSALSAARTLQEIPRSGNYMEGAINYGFDLERVCFGLQLKGAVWEDIGVAVNNANLDLVATTLEGSLTMPYLVVMQAITFGGLFGNRLHVYEYGTRIFSASSLASQPDYDPDFGWLSAPSGSTSPDIFRVRFNFIGSSVVIEKAHTTAVPLKKIATGTRASEFPMFGVMGSPGDGEVGVSGVVLTTAPFPKTIYGHKQQEEDLGSVQSLVEFDLWEESSLVGAGQKTRVFL